MSQPAAEVDQDGDDEISLLRTRLNRLPLMDHPGPEAAVFPQPYHKCQTMGKTSKDKRDIYYRLAKEEGWRARSAYKLLQLDDAYGLFGPAVRNVVDLCAAPGSWSQVLSRKLLAAKNKDDEDGAHPAMHAIEDDDAHGRNDKIAHVGDSGESDDCSPTIVAVDLQPMAPIAGVQQLQADITDARTADLICSFFPDGKRADLVVCDGAPDVTGLHAWDMILQQQLLVAAASIAVQVLRRGGTFVAKVFRGPQLPDLLEQQFNVLFRDVTVYKPASSRASSYEAFVVARDFQPPSGFHPASLLDYLRHDWQVPAQWSDGSSVDDWHRRHIPFLAQGDVYALRGDHHEQSIIDHPDDGSDNVNRNGHHGDNRKALYDSETTHPRDDRAASLQPVQPPTAPFYQAAVELKRGGGGNKK